MSPSSGALRLKRLSRSSTPDLTRLPLSVIPKRYELKLDVDPEKKCYNGSVNIRIFIQTDVISQTIWLHSKDLTILEASIQFSQFAMPFDATEVIEVPEKSCIGLCFAKVKRLFQIN
jgi:aminopeptidase N